MAASKSNTQKSRGRGAEDASNSLIAKPGKNKNLTFELIQRIINAVYDRHKK